MFPTYTRGGRSTSRSRAAADRTVRRHERNDFRKLAASALAVWMPILGMGWLPWLV